MINPKDFEDVLSQLDERERRYICFMDDEYGVTPKGLVIYFGNTLDETRKTCAKLRNLGIVVLGPAYNEAEGTLYGRSYRLGHFGITLQKRLRNDLLTEVTVYRPEDKSWWTIVRRIFL